MYVCICMSEYIYIYSTLVCTLVFLFVLSCICVLNTELTCSHIP